MTNRGYRVSAIAALALMVGSTGAFACGDKFLVPGPTWETGQVPKAKIAASVLLYNPDPAADESMQNTGVTDVLGKAGHQAACVAGQEALVTALSTGDYDLVLMNYDVALALRGEIEKVAPSTAILPVLERKARSSLSAAKKDFGAVLNVPADIGQVVRSIEKALQPR